MSSREGRINCLCCCISNFWLFLKLIVYFACYCCYGYCRRCRCRRRSRHRGPPRLHLTTTEVMVIVWRLRGNNNRTVLYIANVLPLQWAQLTKTLHTTRLGLEFVFLFFYRLNDCLYVGVCFVLPWTIESFPFMFGVGVTNLNEPPSSFLLSLLVAVG